MRYIIILMAIPCLAFAWSDPILVTPDSAKSKKSRVVFDEEENLHFFFANNRFQQSPTYNYDVYHCKFSRNGVRMTDDLRLSDSYTFPPDVAPVMGSDGKIHVCWNDITTGSPTTEPGIYYARIDTDGNIEREATLIFECVPECMPEWPGFFQDSEGNLNAVWVVSTDTIYYGKFDTTGQVLIDKTPVYAPVGGINPWYMNSCMDHQDQIHCVYKNYYGTWLEFNLGYSRVNNSGEVIISYSPLTPETPYGYCASGYIVADEVDNLHLLYLPNENGESHQYYRKMDQDLNTIYDIQLVEAAMTGSRIGDGDIVLDGNGNIVMLFAYNYSGIDLQFMRTTYTNNGVRVIPPETIIENNDQIYPDLGVNSNGMAIYSYTGLVDSLPNGKILYSYVVDQLMVEKEKPDRAFYSDKVGESMVLREGINLSSSMSISPNPANPVTWISFLLPAPQDATVAVYNILGAKVTTIVSGRQPAGTHSFLWNPSQHASGVYIIRLETPQEAVAKRVMVVN